MAVRLSVLLLVGLLSALRANADVVIGGEASTSLPILMNPATLLDSRVDCQVEFRPSLSVTADSFDFDVEGELGYDAADQSPSVAFRRFELSLSPFGFMDIRLGRFAYLPGRAELFSHTDFFTRTDYEALVSGDFSDSLAPSDLVQVKLYRGDYYLIVSAEPFGANLLIPSTTSPWFPMKDLPQQIVITIPVQQTLKLANLTVETPPPAAPSLGQIGVAAEAGGTLSFFDFAAMYYHGRDYSPTLQARIEFPQGLFANYDIVLTPILPTIDAVGIDLATSYQSFRAWVDASYVFDKTLLTKRISADTFTNVLAQSPYLAYTVGASYQFEVPSLTVFAEYSDDWVVSPPAALVLPALARVLSGSINLKLLQDKIALAATSLVSLHDWSFVQLGSISFDPSSEMDLTILFPYFVGAATTDFGQYRDNLLLSTTLRWRF